MTEWTIDKVRAEVKLLDPKVEGETFDDAVVVLSLGVVGPNYRRVAKFTGISRRRVVELFRNLRKNKIICGRRRPKVFVSWFDKEGGGVAFWCDVLAAQGMIVRVEDVTK